MFKLQKKLTYLGVIALISTLPQILFAQENAPAEDTAAENSIDSDEGDLTDQGQSDAGMESSDAGLDSPDPSEEVPAQEAAEPIAEDISVKKPAEQPRRKSSSPIRFRATETFISQYVGDNGHNGEENVYGDDDNFWLYKNLLYLQASNRYFDSAIRLDLTLFHNPPYSLKDPTNFASGGSGYTLLNYGNDFRVERGHATAHIGKVHITAGDFPVNFGRGIALSLIKLDDTGADNALRGGRFQIKIPRMLKIDLLGGITNALNFDPITQALMEDDPMDRIAAAKAEWEIMDALSLGVHGVYMKPRFDGYEDIEQNHLWVDQGPGMEVITGGGSIDTRIGGFSLYLEGNGQQHDNYRVGEYDSPVLNEQGMAFFGEASYDLSPVLLKAEGIYYKQWAMAGPHRGSHSAIIGPPIQYHHMPTLEPMWMINNSLGNEYGGRFTADLYVRESDTQLTLTTTSIKYLGGLKSTGLWEDYPPTTVIHPILKARQRFESTDIMIAAEGGYRYEMTDEPESGHQSDGQLWHVMGDVSVPITGPHSMELKVEVRKHDLGVSESITDYWVTLSTLGYDMAGLWGIALIHEYSDETGGSERKIGGYQLKLPTQHYMWAMINLHPPAPFDGLSLKIYGGSQRGGLKCAGGVCRVYPDAVGAKMEVVYRF